MAFFFMLLPGCKENKDDCEKSITIINNSVNQIYAHESYSYPDSLVFADRFPNPITVNYPYGIGPGSQNDAAVSVNGRDSINYIMSSSKICPSGLIMVYIFDADSLASKTWANDPNLILRRYDLTIDDLNAMNWTITYP